MSVLEDWIDAASAELGVDRAAVDAKMVLDLAREVAHRVDRPAAPVTAFLLGVAVGAGEGLEPAVGRILALTSRWQPTNPA